MMVEVFEDVFVTEELANKLGLENYREREASLREELEAEAENERQLRAFYKDNISGHSIEELMLGQKHFMNAYNSIQEGETLVDALNRYSKTVSNTIVKAMALSTNWDTYSDWYKDVNGFRPYWVV